MSRIKTFRDFFGDKKSSGVKSVLIIKRLLTLEGYWEYSIYASFRPSSPSLPAKCKLFTNISFTSHAGVPSRVNEAVCRRKPRGDKKSNAGHLFKPHFHPSISWKYSASWTRETNRWLVSCCWDIIKIWRWFIFAHLTRNFANSVLIFEHLQEVLSEHKHTYQFVSYRDSNPKIGDIFKRFGPFLAVSSS